MGVYDPLTGKSNSEIAALSRSQHKSQGFGSSPALGSRTEYLSLVQGQPIIGNDPFEGINTSWTRVRGGKNIEKIINEIIANFDLTTPLKSVPKLLEARDLISKIDDQHWRSIKLNEIKSIILNCLGIEIQANTSIPFGVRGESLDVNLLINNPSSTEVVLEKVVLKNRTYQVSREMKKNEVFSKKINHIINESISSPYWLIQEGEKGIYKTKRKEIVGLPNTPPPLVLKLYLLIEGKNIEVQKPLKFRKNDPVKGEVTSTFQVLPSATANLDTPVQLFAIGQTKKVIVQVKSLGKSFKGKLILKSPESWVIKPSHQEVMIDGKGIEKEFIFNVTAPKSEEVVQLRPELTNDKEKIQAAIQEISYDHIPKQYMVQPSSTRSVALN